MYHVEVNQVLVACYRTGRRWVVLVSLSVQRIGYKEENRVVQHHRVEVASQAAARTILGDVVQVCPMVGDEGWLDFGTGYWSPQLRLF